MSDFYRDGGSTIRIASTTRQASSSEATPDMRFLPESCSRIQRWIGEQLPKSTTMTSKSRDSEEAMARREHDHLAELDWELEEFEREMALRFVMHDLQLGFEDCIGRNPIAASTSKRSWLHSKASTATLQQLNMAAAPTPSSPAANSFSPTASSYPPTPRTPTLTCSVPSTAPATPEHPGSLRNFVRPTSAHKHSPSVLSLTSHFSSCTSSASHDTEVDVETEPETAPSASARSLVFHFGKKLKNGILAPPVPSYPSQRRPKTAAPTFMELRPSASTKKKRRVSIPAALAPKKRRMVIRGIKIGDDNAVEGIRRWANSLGEVSRICRAQDGAVWVEFRDRRVAESVCCLQAQVHIPHVGRVVLDWAEGRHPG